jgi:hypothetical protein
VLYDHEGTYSTAPETGAATWRSAAVPGSTKPPITAPSNIRTVSVARVSNTSESSSIQLPLQSCQSTQGRNALAAMYNNRLQWYKGDPTRWSMTFQLRHHAVMALVTRVAALERVPPKPKKGSNPRRGRDKQRRQVDHARRYNGGYSMKEAGTPPGASQKRPVRDSLARAWKPG